eukprot:210594-Chlamydomonas_euryale.AAC.4
MVRQPIVGEVVNEQLRKHALAAPAFGRGGGAPGEVVEHQAERPVEPRIKGRDAALSSPVARAPPRIVASDQANVVWECGCVDMRARAPSQHPSPQQRIPVAGARNSVAIDAAGNRFHTCGIASHQQHGQRAPNHDVPAVGVGEVWDRPCGGEGWGRVSGCKGGEGARLQRHELGHTNATQTSSCLQSWLSPSHDDASSSGRPRGFRCWMRRCTNKHTSMHAVSSSSQHASRKHRTPPPFPHPHTHHTRAVPSQAPLNARVPSGVTATDATSASWPLSVNLSLHTPSPPTCHTRSHGPLPATTTPPLDESATPPTCPPFTPPPSTPCSSVASSGGSPGGPPTGGSAETSHTLREPSLPAAATRGAAGAAATAVT